MSIDKAMPNIPTISASKIKVYRKCQRQYKYKYVLSHNDRPKDDKSIASLMGSALHKAIELKYRDSASPTATFQNYMDNELDKWEAAGYNIVGMEYLARNKKTGREILTKFPWDRFNPLELEFNFTLPFPNAVNPLVNINGIIDMMDMDGSVVDHKSSSYKPNQDELDHDPQFLLYYWAFEQMQGVPPYKIIWNHLRTNTLIEANVAHNYEFKLEQLTEDIMAMIKPAQAYARKEMDSYCRTKCAFYSRCYGEIAANLNVDDTEDV